MTRKTIAIDVDDVLAAGAQSFVAFSNQTWGTNLTIEEYDERWGKMWGVDTTEELRRAKEIYRSGIVRRAAKIDGASRTIARLSKTHKLVIATSRSSDVKNYTLEWIEEHFKGVFSEVHHTGFYDGLPAGAHLQTKAELCKSIGADYLIDDQPKHCFAAAEAGVTSLLFGSYAWNRDIKKMPQNVVRALDWQAVQEYFDGLS